jgi:cytochrome c-type biogenesis protein CcmH/NrfF
MTLLLVAVLAGASGDAGRVRDLERKLMAPCCYQTALADHHSEAATQMKAEIAAWVAEGKSDREIIEAYRERYGPRILAEPEGPAGLWLTVIPVVVLLAGLCVVLLLIRQWRAAG